jgi:hypothetical protein
MISRKNLGLFAGLLITLFCGTYSASSLVHKNAANTASSSPASSVILVADGAAPVPAPPPTPIIKKVRG